MPGAEIAAASPWGFSHLAGTGRDRRSAGRSTHSHGWRRRSAALAQAHCRAARAAMQAGAGGGGQRDGRVDRIHGGPPENTNFEGMKAASFPRWPIRHPRRGRGIAQHEINPSAACRSAGLVPLRTRSSAWPNCISKRLIPLKRGRKVEGHSDHANRKRHRHQPRGWAGTSRRSQAAAFPSPWPAAGSTDRPRSRRRRGHGSGLRRTAGQALSQRQIAVEHMAFAATAGSGAQARGAARGQAGRSGGWGGTRGGRRVDLAHATLDGAPDPDCPAA